MMPSLPRHRGPRAALLVVALLATLLALPAHGAGIGDVVQTSWTEQATRFFEMRDRSVQFALIGAVLLGINSGLLGSFLVVRKMALVGDTLSHAVLPGVALGFLVNMNKDPLAIFLGATAAGLVGTAFVGAITRTTKLKEDTALGLVLATFFGLGLCLMKMIERLPTPEKSGLDKRLFGQIAALESADLWLIGIATLLTIGVVTLLYKELLVTSFDPAFARTTGMPVRLLNDLFMLLLAFSVVVALKAVGVVLVSAMLITPAATAYLLTDRMHRMLLLSAGFGLLTGALGTFLSFLGNHLPTGPFMVLSASLVFASAFFFASQHGVVPRWWRHVSRARRIARENTLKAIYQVRENGGFAEESVTLEELSVRRRITLEEARTEVRQLVAARLATFDEPRGAILVTPDGWRQAASVVRNHRLWELYLTNAANYAADHVHEDAEKIEHILGENLVRQLERRLDFPQHDPHGKPIPSLRDLHGAGQRPPETSVGYGKKQS